MKFNNIKKQFAFTLVELIIVIAIITLLAAIVVVTLNPQSIFQSGRNSQRANDLSTIQNAISKYISESPITGSQRTLNDFSGYSNLYYKATNNLGGRCTSSNFSSKSTVSGAFLLSNTTASNAIDLSNLLNKGYLTKVPLDPMNGLNYKSCIDITNNQFIIFSDQSENISWSNMAINSYVSTTAGTSAYDITRADNSTVTALMSCPLNGSTTCLGGISPASATGPIRYSKGSAMSFNDSTQYLNTGISNIPSGSSARTISAWVKWNGTDSTIFGTNAASGQRYAFMLGTNIFTDGVNGANNITGTSNPTIGQWSHVAFTLDNSNNWKYYLNGVNTQSGTFSIAINTGVVTFANVGRRADTGTTFFNGQLDEVAVYSRDLSPQEVSNQYNSGNPSQIIPDSSTKLLYHFDENGDDPRFTGKAKDSSGNGNDGTLVGSPNFISGIVGIDASSNDSGKVPAGAVANHSGAFMEESTTNLMTNPSFENSTPVLGYGLANTVTLSTDTGYFGNNSLKMVFPGVSSSEGITTVVYNLPTTTYTISASIKSLDTNMTNTYFNLFCNSVYYTSPTFSVDTTYKRYSYTFTIAAGSNCNSNVYLESNYRVGTLWVDGFQLEAKTYASSYTDGSLGSGYAWTGTANNSSSTRTTSNLQYSNTGMFPSTEGTVSLWYKPSIDLNVSDCSGNTNYTLFSSNGIYLGGYNNGTITMGISCRGSILWEMDNGTAETRVFDSGWLKDKWVNMQLTWNNGTMKAYKNGVQFGTSQAYTSFPVISTANMTIGSDNNTNRGAQGIISDFRIYNKELTATEIATIYNSGL